jgi:hypothetical protein
MGHKSRAGYWLNQENGGSQVTNGFNVAAREYWTPDNPTNDYCRLNAAGPNTGLAGGVDKVYNRSFVRLDDITIGYTLPKKMDTQVYGRPHSSDCHLQECLYD